MKILRISLLLLLCSNICTASVEKESDKLVYPFVFAPSEGFFSKIEKGIRKEISLNGRWDFQGIELPENYEKGSGRAPQLPLPSPNDWDKVKIKIPSPWNINSFANRDLEGPDHRNFPSYPKKWEDYKMAWMKKNIVIPNDWDGFLIGLQFEAVAGYTEVYINNEKVAENFDLFLPFNVDITSFVKAGEEIEVLVGVRSQSLFEDNSTKGRRIVPAGSMWGYHISGIWQDVYLTAVPQVYIRDVFIKPLVSNSILEAEVEIFNATKKPVKVTLGGDVRRWLNKSGLDVNFAPVPNWELSAAISLKVNDEKVEILPEETKKIIVKVPVEGNELDFWTPEEPNLYGYTFTLSDKKEVKDIKYERFGWREWTISGTKQYLNGKPIELRGDSWHFMGIPQMTRRYAWAWYKALKDANANAVRPHAQVYPRFYLDMADEMGICVLAETAIWASDGGPKMDSPTFWENCIDHIQRMVLRDRNHASIFGWSVSNENKPVILHVFNKPEWMDMQKEAWKAWRDIVRLNDSTRPWISSDGEDDGDGILPVAVGHYGNEGSMRQWEAIGKPWGIGEHSMAYYGTPEQVSKYNGERAYESQLGRMEGLAYESYDLISQQRNLGASYVSVFNLAWYGLQPLPLGKRNILTAPTLSDGVCFEDYKEGVSGVQPERIGPYSTTFNPGYDPTIPLYRPWPMFEAIKAANAPGGPAWSPWSLYDKEKYISKNVIEPDDLYDSVAFFGENNSNVKLMFLKHGVKFSEIGKLNGKTIIIADGNYMPSDNEIEVLERYILNGSDLWLWAPIPETINSYNKLLPKKIELDSRESSSFIPKNISWAKKLSNSDLYFCEIQRNPASIYGMRSEFVDEGIVLVESCNTNWRRWNQRPEELKTAAVLRSENEEKGASAVFVNLQNKNSSFFISTLSQFTATTKGYDTLDKILQAAGIPIKSDKTSEMLIDKEGRVQIKYLVPTQKDGRSQLAFQIWSPRALDDLLIEPNMPKLDIQIGPLVGTELYINNSKINSKDSHYRSIPLQQGWNQIMVYVPDSDLENLVIRFNCENKPEFIDLLKSM